MTQVCDRIPGVHLNDYNLKDLEYADDTTIFASNLNDLANALKIYEEKASEESFDKIKVMVVSEHPPPSHILVNGHTIQIVKDYVYLGLKIN